MALLQVTLALGHSPSTAMIPIVETSLRQSSNSFGITNADISCNLGYVLFNCYYFMFDDFLCEY